MTGSTTSSAGRRRRRDATPWSKVSTEAAGRSATRAVRPVGRLSRPCPANIVTA
ncbi:hypothetical protein [Lysobacter gummosus]|uniref:hypothetical protein n=1 Tax=Lysobacter gummosus TaxID=262324 RepID=UPI0036417293